MKKIGFGVLGALGGLIIGSMAVYKIMEKNVISKEQKRTKFKSYYEMLNQWIMLKEEGKLLEDYFINNNYKTIAIYGMGEMGNRLYEELRKSDKVEIKYAIDENVSSLYSKLNVVSKEDVLENVDIIVVTAIFDFDNIQEELVEKVTCPVISLEDIVYNY